MRSALVSLGLMAALPLCAQDLGRHWYLDVHQVKPTMEGHYEGLQDGKAFRMDLVNDLALQKDKTKLGVGLEYQGPRFGFELSSAEQDYVGVATVQVGKFVQINGQTWNGGARISTFLKSRTSTVNWTIRALKWPRFWMGLDLGARGIGIDLVANGVEPISGVKAQAIEKDTLPVPQIGPSLRFNAFNGRIEARGFYHFLSYKGSSYHHVGGDVRFFPLSWVGVRAFVDNEEFKVPKGSIRDDLEIGLTRNGSGLGVVLRF